MPARTKSAPRRAAVTGAAGFIGSAVCRRLVADGAGVVAIDLPGTERRSAATGGEPRGADVRDRHALETAFEGADLVIHTAALVREWGPMSDFVATNVAGTAAVLGAAEAAGAERVVALSSVAALGYEHRRPLDERAPLRQTGLGYVDTKAAAERIARRGGAVVVRPGDVIGADSVPWVRRPLELARRRMLAVPRGETVMLPVWIDELVDAILLAAEHGRSGEAYAAWCGVPTSFGEYFDGLVRAAGIASSVPRLPRGLIELGAGLSELAARAAGAEPPLSAASATYIGRRAPQGAERAREELGWEPRIDALAALERLRPGLAENAPPVGH